MWMDRLTYRQAERQADMTKLIVAFRNFEKASKTTQLMSGKEMALTIFIG